MAPPTVPVGFPSVLTAGNTEVWDDAAFSNERGTFLSTDGYALTYELRASGQAASLPGATQGTGWRTTLDTTTSDALRAATSIEAETLRWYAFVTKAGERYPMAQGTALLYPNPTNLATATSADEAELAVVQSAIRTLESGGMSAFQLHGRAVTLLDLPALVKREGQLKARIAAARNGGILPSHQIVFGSIRAGTMPRTPLGWPYAPL